MSNLLNELPNQPAEESEVSEVKEPDNKEVEELKDTLVMLQAEDYGVELHYRIMVLDNRLLITLIGI